MSVSTHGLRVHRGPQMLRAAVELLSSMRFAIALLTVICIASIIGTVLKQHEPIDNYVNQFGPFWAELFRAARARRRLQRLVVPADPAVPGGQHLAVRRAQHAAILVDLKTFKEDIRAQSLKAFGHRAETRLGETPEAAANRIGQLPGERRLEGQAAAARGHGRRQSPDRRGLDGRGACRRRPQAGLHRGAQRHRAGVHRRPARRRPDRARADLVQRQERLTPAAA